RVHRPLQRLDRGAEVQTDRVQGGRHDLRVERDHERRGRRQREHPGSRRVFTRGFHHCPVSPSTPLFLPPHPPPHLPPPSPLPPLWETRNAAERSKYSAFRYKRCGG